MAKKEYTSDDAVINGNPLMAAEVKNYVKNSQTVSTYNRIAEYLFWGATTVLAGLVAGITGVAGASLSPLLMTACAVVLPLTVIGGIFFNRKAADVESHNAVLQSDIDSQNQAHRMVQAFAKVQANDKSASADEIPFTAGSQKSWSERVGQSTSTLGNSWAARVEADRQVEEQNALAALQR